MASVPHVRDITGREDLIEHEHYFPVLLPEPRRHALVLALQGLVRYRHPPRQAIGEVYIVVLGTLHFFYGRVPFDPDQSQPVDEPLGFVLHGVETPFRGLAAHTRVQGSS